MRPVPGFDGYFVTDDGRVFSTRTRGRRDAVGPLHALTIGTNDRGYETVHIRGRTTTVHVLVAAAWLGPRPAGCDVCHNDGDKRNNRAANLRYAPRAANVADAIAHGTFARGSRNGRARLTEADVVGIRSRLAAGATHRAVAREFGISHPRVTSISTGKAWAHVKGETT
jgi:hypothetical protein